MVTSALQSHILMSTKLICIPLKSGNNNDHNTLKPLISLYLQVLMLPSLLLLHVQYSSCDTLIYEPQLDQHTCMLLPNTLLGAIILCRGVCCHSTVPSPLHESRDGVLHVHCAQRRLTARVSCGSLRSPEHLCWVVQLQLS